jgi:hypothetical protein
MAAAGVNSGVALILGKALDTARVAADGGEVGWCGIQ